MIRIFVAIDFPKEIKQQFADLVDLLIEDGYPLTFEKEENFHLTLKFLGWVEDKFKIQNAKGKMTKQSAKLEELNEAIKRAAIGVKPFWFKPTKIGYFLKESLIVWVGVEAQEGLMKLVRQLEDELAKIGFAREKRQFSPHITFAKKRRIHPIEKWQRIAEEIKNKFHPEFNRFRVGKIVLMQSTLAAQGSIYTPISSFSLSDSKV